MACAAISIQAIITTFAVFRRVPCAFIVSRSVFVLVMFRTGSPPPHTKTLKTKRVFLYRAALLFQGEDGKVIENFVASLSFHI